MFKLDALKNFRRYRNLKKKKEVEKKYRRIVFTPEQAVSVEAETCSRDQIAKNTNHF